MANYKFTKTFIKQADAVMANLGLTKYTSPQQKANNTLFYYDAKTDQYYGFYESGYCRRFIPCTFHWGTTAVIQGKNYKGYQLNRTKTKCNNLGKNKVGETIYSYNKSRIPANPLEQLGIITYSIVRQWS